MFGTGRSPFSRFRPIWDASGAGRFPERDPLKWSEMVYWLLAAGCWLLSKLSEPIALEQKNTIKQP